MLDYTIHLAELLHFLHSMTPPLIHRDIKPQNVIVDEDGNCHFIDMGISRFFNDIQSTDTLIMGTKQMAPPEQFGFRQTDCRSDIYSLGVLMYYCITGEYTITDEGLEKITPPVQKIIKKATMFDPDQRYANAKALMSDLLAARFQPYIKNRADCGTPAAKPKVSRTSRFVRAGIAGVVFLLLFFAAFLLRAKPKPYSFTEPLIEEAVCRQLQKAPGTVTKSDLTEIKELHIFGLLIYEDESEVWLHGSYPWFYDETTRQDAAWQGSGTIRSLKDIENMPNLETLCLYNQQITDISCLADTTVSCLGLGYNPISDLSPLSGNPNIQTLLIPGLELTDVSVPASMPHLTRLNISATGIRSIKPLSGSPVRELDLFELMLDDYSELHLLPDLQKLDLNHMTVSIMEQLAGLELTELAFYYSDSFALADIRSLPDLQKLTFFGDQGPFYQTNDKIDLPNLKELTLSYTQISDFRKFDGLPNLETLIILNADCLSYDGLAELPSLRNIICTEDQKTKIQSSFPDRFHF